MLHKNFFQKYFHQSIDIRTEEAYNVFKAGAVAELNIERQDPKMQDYIYDENGQLIETDFELNYQYNEEAWHEYCSDNAGSEYDYEDLM